MRKLLVICLCLLCFGNLFSQYEPQTPNPPGTVEVIDEVVYDTQESISPLEFSEDDINDFKDDEDFNYEEIKESETWWDRFRRWLSRMWGKFWDWILGDYEATGFLAFLIESLPYLIIAGIIGFVIWVFIRLNPGMKLMKSKEKPEVFFTEEEEIIKSKDIQSLIQKALENRDYRLAVRYYYLLILKKLTDAEVIDYEFDKTNSDYLREIKEQTLSKGFSKVTLLYDYIWYGNFGVTETDYQKAQALFNSVEHQIPKPRE